MDTIHIDTLILGAGAAGISYAFLMKQGDKKDFLMLEKEKHPFGLMKSFSLGNLKYDIGGHALHQHMPTLKLLEQYGVSSYQQKRKAYVYHKGKYLPFPFQLHLAFLDPEEKILCYRDFMKAQQRNSKQYPQNLDQLLKTSFGETLYQNFLKPYNKKIWKTDLTQISTNWKGRITKESIATFKEGYLHKNTENYGSNAWVYYPRQGGFETYLYPFFKQIKERILYEQSVLKIDPIKKLVLTSTHIIHYTTLVSTIPLPILLSLVGHKDKENYPLEYLSLCICSFLFPKSGKLDKQRIYSADPKYLFHKCAINSNSNLTMKRSPHCVISFEISYKQQSYTDTIYLNNCKKFLSFLGYSTDMILQQECRHFTYAYPIQTVGLETYRDTLSQQLVNNDIYLLGRCGNWEYLNFDSILEKTSHLYSSLNP